MDAATTRFFNEIQIILEYHGNLVFLDNFHRCILWDGSKVTKNGVDYGYKYVKLPYRQLKSRQYTHRLAYMLKYRNYDLPRQFDVSHLCHNSLCINPDHLTLEPHNVNNNRIHCVNENKCFGHQPYKDCLLNQGNLTLKFVIFNIFRLVLHNGDLSLQHVI